ncbi:MAG: arylsulfatase [Kiritimatiellae bacterium]|nr:arylsulfatase [Kiritimatiellia bacterium]
MIRRVLGCATAALAVAVGVHGAPEQQRPNILLIYADDLGYGDVGCYGARTIPTPALDRLAHEGTRFRSAYAAAATCTPSRYAMLTGEYAWRRRGTDILPGDAALIIEPGRTTLASILREVGYRTAVVGKWHLGLGAGNLDWNGPIRPGPLELGFEYAFLLPATGDRVPCVYVENDRVVGLDPADPIEVSYGRPLPGVLTGRARPDLVRMHPSHGHDQTIVRGIPRIGYMRGGQAALWRDEEIADEFVRRASAFIERAATGPWFLLLSLHDPHVPRVPHPRWVGRTPHGPRGDAIAQADGTVGAILELLDRLGLATQTLVVVTSDNGPVVDDGYQDEAVERLGDHRPAGPLRGGKYSKFEGGTRVPWIVRWPGRVPAGAVSDAIVCQIDLLASFAALVGRPLTAADSPDGLPLLEAMLGRSATGRTDIVLQGTGGLALRRGRWKYIPPAQGPVRNANTGIELGNSPEPQLYDLASDVGETNNLASLHPELVAELQTALDAIRAAGCSRPGAVPSAPACRQEGGVARPERTGSGARRNGV